MKIHLIGKTEVSLFVPQEAAVKAGFLPWVMPGKAKGSQFEKRIKIDTDNHWHRNEDGQELIEFAGRLCYESFDLPSENTATNDKYIRNIVKLGHESVLEHVSVTFYVEGVSRNLTHELIRHRHLSFSELSQRYVDMEDANYILPPLWRNLPQFGGADKVPMPDDIKEKYRNNIGVSYVLADGSRKRAREAARAVMPGATETKLVVSGNLRAWRDVLKKRWSAHADAEIQELAGHIYDILNEEYPDVFADITYQEK
jgi:thymidylate synthase (FAD)